MPRGCLPHSPPPCCTSVSAAEYALISLNILKYPWKCLKKLLWLCQGSECAWSSYIFDMPLKMPRVLNVQRFWISHGCVCKGYTEFWIRLNMPQECLNMPQYALMTLNMPGNGWISLNMPGNVWLNSSDFGMVLNMRHHLRYSTGFWVCLSY